MSFHELLSEFNPLQYIPVIGAIYRAVTGDTISVAARTAGGFVVSGLIGGPVGVATNILALAVENMTGVDPEKIEQRVLASIGLGARPAPAPASAPHVEVAAAKISPRAAPATAAGAWSAAQLTAYGIATTAQGNLKQGNTEGSDVLNGLELARHAPGVTPNSYAANNQIARGKS